MRKAVRNADFHHIEPSAGEWLSEGKYHPNTESQKSRLKPTNQSIFNVLNQTRSACVGSMIGCLFCVLRGCYQVMFFKTGGKV